MQYAVFLKTDLSKFRVPCEAGPRIVRLRGILSWATPPPPAIRTTSRSGATAKSAVFSSTPGQLEGHIPLIETVGDILVPDINPANGLATGDGQIGAFSVLDSPFGGEVRITGRIGNPPNSFGGGATPFKYRIEVFGPPPFNTWTAADEPDRRGCLGVVQRHPACMCAPGDFVCDVAADADRRRRRVRARLVHLSRGHPGTEPAVPGRGQAGELVHERGDGRACGGSASRRRIRSGPAAVPGLPDRARAHRQHAAVRDRPARARRRRRSRPNPPLDDHRRDPQRQSAAGGRTAASSRSGRSSPATMKCTIRGSRRRTSTSTALSLTVIPAGPANGVTPSPSSRSYPLQVPTTGEAGTWTLDTTGHGSVRVRHPAASRRPDERQQHRATRSTCPTTSASAWSRAPRDRTQTALTPATMPGQVRARTGGVQHLSYRS